MLSKAYFTIEHNYPIGAPRARASAQPTAVAETAHTPSRLPPVTSPVIGKAAAASRDRSRSRNPPAVQRLHEIETSIQHQTTRIDSIEIETSSALREIETAHTNLLETTRLLIRAVEGIGEVYDRRDRILREAHDQLRGIPGPDYEVRDRILREAHDRLPRILPAFLWDVHDRLRQSYPPGAPNPYSEGVASSVATAVTWPSNSSNVALEDGMPDP